jgi:hypothetical protein
VNIRFNGSYNFCQAVDKVFLVAVACGAFGSMGALFIRNVNIKGRVMGGAVA